MNFNKEIFVDIKMDRLPSDPSRTPSERNRHSEESLASASALFQERIKSLVQSSKTITVTRRRDAPTFWIQGSVQEIDALISDLKTACADLIERIDPGFVFTDSDALNGMSDQKTERRQNAGAA